MISQNPARTIAVLTSGGDAPGMNAFRGEAWMQSPCTELPRARARLRRLPLPGLRAHGRCRGDRPKLSRRLEIEPLSFSLAEQVNYKIVEIEPGKVYEVRFASLPNTEKRYRGFLKLKTGYEEKPEIVIPIWGDFAD